MDDLLELLYNPALDLLHLVWHHLPQHDEGRKLNTVELQYTKSQDNPHFKYLALIRPIWERWARSTKQNAMDAWKQLTHARN